MKRICIGLVTVIMSFPLLVNGKKNIEKVPPDLTQGGKIDHSLQWTLGSTGARGWIFNSNNNTEKARQIYVTKVEPGSPADGILMKGDVILGIGDKQFSSDPRKAFAAAITESEKSENKGELKLLRWRPFDTAHGKDGKTEVVELQLKVMGTFSDTVPYDCEKTKKIVDMAVEAIMKDGLDNGNPNPIDGDGIPGIINALGLMATGREDVMPIVKTKMMQIAKEPVDGYKWGHAWSLLGLAEYYLYTGDESVLPAIRRYAIETAKGQSIAGTWGHGFAAEDGVLGGYGAMNQVSITHTIGLILAKKCGVNDPVVQKAIDSSMRFFSYYIGKGSVPYGAHEAGAQHGPDDNGKSSGVSVAMNLYGNKKGTEFLAKHGVCGYPRIEVGHASNFFHIKWQGLASAHLGKKAATAHFKQCQWYYELLRDWRGKYRHHEDPNHKEPHKYWDATGARLLFLCLPLKKIYLTGKGGYIADEVGENELDAIIDSGRYYGKYDTLEDKELLKRLGDWCHATRLRAARELVKRKGDWCTIGIEMYTEGSMNEKYGATRLFEALKEKAAPAVDHLIKQIKHKDMWLRIRTVHALGAIGDPARKAAPALLEAVKLEDPADNRNMYRRAISMALFSKRKGLLSKRGDLDKIPRKDLIAALKILLKCEEGQSVTALQVPLRQLTFEELQPLWPEIVYRIEHRLSENVMFARMQGACLELLADHKVEEGLRLAAYRVMTQNGWGGGRRNKSTLNSLRKYGRHAKVMFFPLQTYLQKNPGFNSELQAFKKDINESEEKPELVSIAPYLGDYEIGDHYEKLVTKAELRKMIAKDALPDYWKAYEMLQKLLDVKPQWKSDVETILAELMAIPRASEIIGAHHAINKIKQDVKDQKMGHEQAIKELTEYRKKYDINDRGPNLVYWHSLMWISKLKSGGKLK
jgi:hypothetical protein